MDRLIRPLQATDIPPCVALWREVEGLVLCDDSDHPEAMIGFLNRNPGLSFVAEEDGMVIGAVLCGHDGRRAYLYHLAVLPDRQRSRCATALLLAVQRALGALGITRCHATVRSRNLTAMHFWDSIGAELRQGIEMVTVCVAAE